MSRVKLHSALPESSGLSTLGKELWDDLGGRYLAVVELKVAERTEPGDEDAEASCKVRVLRCEVATTDGPATALRALLDELRSARVPGDALPFEEPSERDRLFADIREAADRLRMTDADVETGVARYYGKALGACSDQELREFAAYLTEDADIAEKQSEPLVAIEAGDPADIVDVEIVDEDEEPGGGEPS